MRAARNGDGEAFMQLVRRPALWKVPVESVPAPADRRAADPVLRSDLDRALGAWSAWC